MKEFTIRDDAAFKLKAKMWPCLAPNNLYCVEFIGEQYNDKNEKINESTYQFFLEQEHLEKMAQGLLS